MLIGFLTWLIARIAFSLYGWWQLLIEPQRFDNGEHSNLATNLTSPLYPWTGTWMHWDALWYKYVALHGYHAGDNSPHFAPLLPLLSRLVMNATGEHFGPAALIVNGIAAIIAFATIIRLATLDGTPDLGPRAIYYICAFPVGFYLFIPYTEALFLCVTTLSFYFARTHRWWWSGIFGFLATAAHFQGVLLAPALFWEYLQQWREGNERLSMRIISTALPGIAFLLFAAYVRFIVGEPRSLVVIDQHWGTVIRAPWDVLRLAFYQIVVKQDGVELLNLVAVVFVALTCLLGIGQQRPSYIIFGALQLVPILVHTSYISPLESASRYLVITFPAFLLLAKYGRNHWVDRSIIFISLVIQGIFLWVFAIGGWVA
ncbi:MAG: hypothetical protein M1118_02925 [Chloroflexi bacterium]|nr:hypothetical protein [Chloroflexota bacterium]